MSFGPTFSMFFIAVSIGAVIGTLWGLVTLFREKRRNRS